MYMKAWEKKSYSIIISEINSPILNFIKILLGVQELGTTNASVKFLESSNSCTQSVVHFRFSTLSITLDHVASSSKGKRKPKLHNQTKLLTNKKIIQNKQRERGSKSFSKGNKTKERHIIEKRTLMLLTMKKIWPVSLALSFIYDQ